MKIIFHPSFYTVYTSDPAASRGRMEAVVSAIEDYGPFVEATPASEEAIAAIHTERHIADVRRSGLYDISALAAGGAIMAADIGMTESCFGLIRPPGHHASAGSAWGFCYFNNMAIALTDLRRRGRIRNAFVLDFDLHYGDGTVNILESSDWVKIHNPEERNRDRYIQNTARMLSGLTTDIIGISAGFDHHREDWGGLLETEDYYTMGSLVRKAADKASGGCFAILEGGYNHDVLGRNVRALLEGLSDG